MTRPSIHPAPRLAMTRTLRRSVAVLLVLPALAACDRGGAAAPRPAAVAGTYAGSIPGGVAYSLVIPEGAASPFAVHGTVTDRHGTHEVHGTAIYLHPDISFELVRASEGVESVFGVRGTVSDSRREIAIPRGGATLTLRQR